MTRRKIKQASKKYIEVKEKLKCKTVNLENAIEAIDELYINGVISKPEYRVSYFDDSQTYYCELQIPNFDYISFMESKDPTKGKQSVYLCIYNMIIKTLNNEVLSNDK